MIEAIICDMDGTLVEYTIPPFYASWDALSLALSEKERKEWIKNRDYYYPKKELHKEWQEKQLGIIKGLSLEEVNRHLFPIPYCPGVREFFSNQGNGYKKGILTSGINLVADKIVEELGFDFSLSYFIEVENGRLTGRGRHVGELWEKDLMLKNFALENNFRLDRTMYIGDNENDIPALDIVGCSVVYKPKTKETREHAQHVINDFREVEEIVNKNES